MDPQSFNAPGPSNTTSAPHIPFGAPFSYNIPPTFDAKEDNTNVNVDPPSYNTISPDDNLQVNKKKISQLKPQLKFSLNFSG